jgi:hypothetical protein
VFGLVGGSAVAPDQLAIHRETIDTLWGHEEDDSDANDSRRQVAEAGVLGHRMLLPPLALQGTVADHRQDAILRRRNGLQGLLGEPPQQGLGAPGGRAPSAAVVLVR